MGQLLRAHVAFAEDQGSVPSTHIVSQPSISPVSGKLIPSSDTLGYSVHKVHT